ncbi:hypothetical protein CGLO_08793 [Colletotrichum gloeosporioides Cg-14]|uniref:Uncharacterized protein n=1 Tax=Colletotrichum gloeosporioides (strain Cg-14) TaxID=1237896 RepID=T0K820_COLGC|nr:hypothetical protein CGLO_08793 [Colletotrichum gloeosporioides Cg-14]
MAKINSGISNETKFVTGKNHL